MTALRDPPRLEGEADVDLGRHVAAVATRWWLILLGLVAGVLIALLVSVGGKDVYRAAALVYPGQPDRKSTRLNSSHRCISYAVFCLKKKNNSHHSSPTPATHPSYHIAH